MTDILIYHENGSLLERLNSEDKATVGDLFDVIGMGALRKDGVLKANKELVLSPGTYVFVPKKPQNELEQQQQQVSGLTTSFKAELDAMNKKLNEVQTRDTFAVSYSNYYEEKNKQARIQFWHAPGTTTSSTLGKHLLDAQSEIGPEKKKVKPFWKKFMQEDKHQIVPGIGNDYEAASLGPKTPDICFFQSNVEMPSAESFIAAADCKGDKWTGRSTAEKGQIMLYLHKILDAQPNRKHAYGFVTNNNIVVLVKAYRADESPFQVLWQISDVLTYVSGMALFIELMKKDTGYRPNPMFEGCAISTERPLRPGGSCRAYLGRYQGREVVVKVYSSEAIARDNHTKMTMINDILRNCEKQNAVWATLPTSCGISENWLLVEPIGQSFHPTSFSVAHLKRVLNTLMQTHLAGYVHCDVRMANMFDLGGGQILLNDWGSMAAKNGSKLYDGCPPPFRHPSLDGAVYFLPLPKHDLYSLVYSLAKLVAPGFNSNAIKEVFVNAFLAAENADYDGVYESMKPFLFLKPYTW